MPYVSKEFRNKLKVVNVVNSGKMESTDVVIDDSFLSNPGNLNYLISTFVNMYIDNKGLSYTNINEVIGVLECAKLELYRRIAVPYEDKKIAENGDVYTVQHQMSWPS